MSDITQLYLSQDDVVAQAPSGAIWRREGGTLTDRLDAVVERIAAVGPRRHVRVWLSGALCRPVCVPRVAGTKSHREQVKLMEAIAQRESGLALPCRVVVADDQGDASRVAVVVEEATLNAIESRCASARIRALSIRPWWDLALESAVRENAALKAFAAWEGHSLTILVGAGHGFSSARTLWPLANAPAASAAFARALVSTMVTDDECQAVRLDWSGAVSSTPLSPVWSDAAFGCCVKSLGSAS